MRSCDFPVWPQDLGKGLNVPQEQVGAPPCQCSRIAAHNRTNCGFPGITPDTCFGRGCCFDSKIRNIPWCFRPLPKQELEECVMDVSVRKNCGYPGISPQECAARKCCFSDTIVNVPWCFFPISVEGNVPAGRGWDCSW
uniref:Trefoil factor 2 n=1 Tax=Ailuropoda melanoleuca TaxID=9646 RepID=A0A7N5K7Z4_AILME